MIEKENNLIALSQDNRRHYHEAVNMLNAFDKYSGMKIHKIDNNRHSLYGLVELIENGSIPEREIDVIEQVVNCARTIYQEIEEEKKQKKLYELRKSGYNT